MLDSHSKPVKTSVMILVLIAVLSILWGIFNHRFLGDWLTFILAGDIFLILLLLCSKFSLRSPTLKPIFKGFIRGLIISVALIVPLLITFAVLDYGHQEAGGSSDMAGLAGIYMLLLWGILSFITMFLSLLIGTARSYRRSKNVGVLLFLILLIVTIAAVPILFKLYYIHF